MMLRKGEKNQLFQTFIESVCSKCCAWNDRAKSFESSRLESAARKPRTDSNPSGEFAVRHDRLPSSRCLNGKT